MTCNIDLDTLAIKSFKPRAAIGVEGIPTYFYKGYTEFLIKPLYIIFNSAVERGIFPDQLKLGRILPVYKSDNFNMLQNFRPITVLLYCISIQNLGKNTP